MHYRPFLFCVHVWACRRGERYYRDTSRSSVIIGILTGEVGSFVTDLTARTARRCAFRGTSSNTHRIDDLKCDFLPPVDSLLGGDFNRTDKKFRMSSNYCMVIRASYLGSCQHRIISR